MDNVIHVDFSNNPDDSDYEFVLEIDPNIDLDHYLEGIRTLGLDEDDVLEVKEAIADYEVYAAADEVVQTFADGWLKNLL